MINSRSLQTFITLVFWAILPSCNNNNNAPENNVSKTSDTVTIGSQIWATKNLSVTTFRNGDNIPEAKTSEEWKKAGKEKKAAWCYYNNDPANGEKYGKLYNWYAVSDPRGIAPEGYHVPGSLEWERLISGLGGNYAAGKKLKSKTNL